MTAVVGIDPGVRGAVAVLHIDGRVLYLKGFDPKMTQREVVALVKVAAGLMSSCESRTCFIEKVGYRPTDGGLGANTFGRIDGLLRGAALALDLDVMDVAPQMWQSRLGCMSGGNKNVTKSMAQLLFKGIAKEITHTTADALLIAEFGRRTLLRTRP